MKNIEENDTIKEISAPDRREVKRRGADKCIEDWCGLGAEDKPAHPA